MSKELIGAGGLLKTSWSLVMANFVEYAKLVTIMVVFVILYMGGFGLVMVAENNLALQILGGGLAAVGYVALIIASMWIDIVFVEMSDHFADKKKYIWRKIWALDTWSLVLQNCLATLIFGALVLFGGLAFIIPGVLFFIWFMFFKYAVYLERRYDLSALQFSYQIVRGRWWKAFWRCLVFFVLICVFFGVSMLIVAGVGAAFGILSDLAGTVAYVILTAAFYGAVFYLFSPVAVLYPVLLYRDLKKTK